MRPYIYKIGRILGLCTLLCLYSDYLGVFLGFFAPLGIFAFASKFCWLAAFLTPSLSVFVLLDIIVMSDAALPVRAFCFFFFDINTTLLDLRYDYSMRRIAEIISVCFPRIASR